MEKTRQGFLEIAVGNESTAVTDVSSLFPAGAYHGFKVRAVLVAANTVSTESVPFRGSAWSTKRCFLTVKLVLAVVVVSTVESTLPPCNGMRLDFLGYSGWVLAERFRDTDVAHLAIQGILDELPILGTQVLILFHSRYLLNPRHSRKRIA